MTSGSPHRGADRSGAVRLPRNRPGVIHHSWRRQSPRRRVLRQAPGTGMPRRSPRLPGVPHAVPCDHLADTGRLRSTHTVARHRAAEAPRQHPPEAHARPRAHFQLGTLDDIVGVRVICQSISDVVALSSQIGSSPKNYRIKNYMRNPAATGYRGVHHIMRFDQPAWAGLSLTVRYEIQVRTCLQHRWAVWSESYGERAKIGQSDAAHHDELRSVASEIARWEERNPARVQEELLPYSGVRTIAVCWRPPRGPSTPLLFHDDVREAVSWLNRLEAAYPARRENALLLVGVVDHADIRRALRLTHPLYVGIRAVHPRFYIPSGSS